MRSLWQDNEAAKFQGELGLRVYTSRLLGQDPSLVLHGGGNTSVKICEKTLFGEEELLYVKGSGSDLVDIKEAGFAPVKMSHLLKLATLSSLSDPAMVNELKTHMTRANAPTPSVETILHAVLPYRFVDHTHADAILAITNTKDGEQRVREIYGDDVVVIPYVMPGFDLARLVATEFPRQANAKTQGMVLLKHGIFSFGASARESYERMIELVSRAERYLEKKSAWSLPIDAAQAIDPQPAGITLAQLRKEISQLVGAPMILRSYRDATTLNFVRHKNVHRLSQQGPATPDHVIRSKQLPMLGRDLHAYAQAYREYFARHATRTKEPKTILDCAPRMILDNALGLICCGRTSKDANIVGDIYQHTMEVILRAEKLGGYEALPERDIFDMEYWDLEQAKLKGGGKPPVFTGEVVLITGAASGIGKACVQSFLNRGAAVVGLDLAASVTTQQQRQDYLGIVCDVTDDAARTTALNAALERFGGIDTVVLNAGIFPGGCRIDQLSDSDWRRVMSINLDANLAFMRETHPYLKLAPNGGRIAVVGSKNVPAPGPGAAAYSASKAALNQLARVAALEWGQDNIRINSVHPNAVFDTGIWTDEVLAARAKHYGLTIEQYKRNNVLRVEVTSHDVAELVAEMCGPLFAKTTGAQVPIDGGNERVI